MAERALLVEGVGDAGTLARLATPTDRWLALSPIAIDELGARGLSCEADGDVCPPEELNRIGHDNFARAEALVEPCDRLVLSHCPAIRDLGLRPFRGHFSRVKLLLDAITIRLAILRRSRAQGAEAFVKVRGRTPGPKTDVDLFYRAEASLYDDVLELLGAQAGTLVTWVPPPAPQPLRRAWRGETFRRLAGLLRDRLLTVMPRPRPVRAPRVVALGVGYDLRKALELCRAAGAEAFWLDMARPQLRRFPGWQRCTIPGVDPGRALGAAIQRVELGGSSDPIETVCRDDVVSYAPLVRRALQRYLQEGLPQMVALQDFLAAAHRHLGITLMLSPSGPERMLSSAVFDFCRQSHIPIAVMQHGIYGHVDNPITNYFEFGFDGDFLAWGAGVEAHYGATKRGEVRFVPLGSPSLEDLVARRHRTARRARRIMYITTDLRGTSAYFPGGQPFLDTTYYRFQQTILTLLAHYQHTYDLWLKVPPGMDRNDLASNPIRVWLKASGIRITVEQRPLVQVIEEPALFLIDFPSTTLLQCLATRAEVIVFTGSPHFRLLPEARRLLAARATCCESPEALLQAIEARLQRGLPPIAPASDDAFLSRYGTFQHDGGALERLRAYLQAQGVGTASAPAVAEPIAWQHP